jgi:heptaprenyl diphosphate synthase
MTLMMKKSDFSLIGVSVAGGVSHNVGQLIIAMMVLESTSLIYYGPALLISGVITGLLIGWLTTEVSRRVHL